MRVSYAVQQCLPVNFQFMEFIHFPEGFKLVSLVSIYIQLIATFLAFNILGSLLCESYKSRNMRIEILFLFYMQ